MTIDGFLVIPGIEGEAQSAQHEGHIEAHGVAWQIGVPTSGDVGSRRRGRAQWSTFEFAKSYDRSSPYIVDAVAKGVGFDEVEFIAARTMGDGALRDYLTIKLKTASITNYQVGTGQDQLEEVVSMTAEKLEITYTEFSPQGSVLGDHSVDLQREL